MNMSTICKNCGGEYGLHRGSTNQCPVGGREAPIALRQRWEDTTFEPVAEPTADAKKMTMPTTTEQQKIKITRLQERIDRLEEFQNEVLSLWNWGDEDVEAKTDPLEFVKEQVKELRKWDAIHRKRNESIANIDQIRGMVHERNEMNKALEICIMFLTNANTITDEKQADLIKHLREAGRADLADAVAVGGMAAVISE